MPCWAVKGPNVNLVAQFFFVENFQIHLLDKLKYIPLYKSTLLMRFCGGGGVRWLFLRSSGVSHTEVYTNIQLHIIQLESMKYTEKHAEN